MKRFVLSFLILLFLPIASYSKERIPATLFYNPHCKPCLRIKEEVLPSIKEKYRDKVEWKELNTYQNPENLKRFLAVSKQFKIEKPIVPAILIGNDFFLGTKEIEGSLTKAIDIILATRTRFFSIAEIDSKELFNKLSLFVIIISGLGDGVNPCAFAVIVFFISFLAVYGYRKKEIIYVGTSYCLAIFIMYVLLGLGFLKFIAPLSNMYFIKKVFDYFIIFFCFFLSAVSLYDFFKFKRTKDASGTVLQLPKFLKRRINLIIGSRLREKKNKGVAGLVVSSFIVGLAVSVLEGACTGQVYWPILLVIWENPSLKLKAFSYLLLYNFMFIVPLILTFILFLLGVSSKVFNDFLKKHLGLMKVLMVLLFFALGSLILLRPYLSNL